MISHFALYGAGVTSYFKFLKYCCWSFFVVSCAVLVHLFVNVNGGSITTVSNTNRISWTTIGNLGNSINVTEVTISVLAVCLLVRVRKRPSPLGKLEDFSLDPKYLDSWFYSVTPPDVPNPPIIQRPSSHYLYHCFIQTT